MVECAVMMAWREARAEPNWEAAEQAISAITHQQILERGEDWAYDAGLGESYDNPDQLERQRGNLQDNLAEFRAWCEAGQAEEGEFLTIDQGPLVLHSLLFERSGNPAPRVFSELQHSGALAAAGFGFAQHGWGR